MTPFCVAYTLTSTFGVSPYAAPFAAILATAASPC